MLMQNIKRKEVIRTNEDISGGDGRGYQENSVLGVITVKVYYIHV